MDIEHFILAHGSSIDQERNSLSVFEIVEDFGITVPGTVPQVTLPVQIIVVLRREPAEWGETQQTFRLELFNPDAAAVFQQDFPIKLQAQHRRARFRINMPFMVGKAGSYRFKLSRADKEEIMRETDIIVQVRVEQQQPTMPPVIA